MATYLLDDGSFLDDDTSANFAIGDGFVRGVGGAGTLIAWIEAGNSVSATAVSTLTAVVTYTQEAQNVGSGTETGGAGLGGRIYALDDGFVLDDGVRTWSHGESVIGRTSGIVAERQMVVAVTQDDNTYVFTATVGGTSSVSLTANYTQDANTLVSVIGDTREPGVDYAQAANTVSATCVVKRVLLTATGELDVGASVVYTQDGNAFAITGDTGNNNIFFLQDDNVLVAEANVLGNLSATAAYTQDDNVFVIRGTSAAIWGGVASGGGTWAPVPAAGGEWTET